MSDFYVRLLSCVIASICVSKSVAETTLSDEQTATTKALVFHASFDKSPNANVGDGDKHIYTAESLERKTVVPGIQSDAVHWDAMGGRVAAGKKPNGALHFKAPTKQLVFFKGGKNLPYRKTNFNGTVAMWMKLSPMKLPKGYVDPLQITDKKWNDASFFVDFDQSKERPFRLGVFSDFKFWNPKNRNFDDIPQQERPMVPVTQWPFDESRWTHVVFTWSNINTEKDAKCTLYVDGKSQGHIGGKQRFTWSPEKAVIMLGINYTGWIDDLMIFDRSLADREAADLSR